MKCPRVAKILSLAPVVLVLSLFVTVDGGEFSVPSQEKIFYDIPQSWTALDEEQATERLRELVAISESNRQAVSTFHGNFYHESRIRFGGNSKASRGISEGPSDRARYLDTASFVEVAADFKEKKIYRNARREAETDRESNWESVSKKTRIPDFVYVDTPEGHVSTCRSERFVTLSELPGYPAVPDKNVVWLSPSGNRFEGPDATDAMRKDFWSTHFLLSEFPEGADDSQGNVTVTLFEAVDRQGVQWYRCRYRSDSDAIEWNILGNEASGYQPVYMAKTGNSQDIEVLKQLIWERIGGVYLPAEVYRVSYSDDGELSDRRHTVINNIKINEPIDQKLFTYQGMGLADGCLLLDTIQGKVFKFRGGKPVAMADFYTNKYMIRAQIKAYRDNILNVLFGAVLVGIAIYFLQAKIRKQPTRQNVRAL
ncbi:MAG: hypothetical protein ACOX6D_04195 [Thermoguttaceae bacterium]|jgi:hypothetical protein